MMTLALLHLPGCGGAMQALQQAADRGLITTEYGERKAAEEAERAEAAENPPQPADPNAPPVARPGYKIIAAARYRAKVAPLALIGGDQDGDVVLHGVCWQGGHAVLCGK